MANVSVFNLEGNEVGFIDTNDTEKAENSGSF